MRASAAPRGRAAATCHARRRQGSWTRSCCVRMSPLNPRTAPLSSRMSASSRSKSGRLRQRHYVALKRHPTFRPAWPHVMLDTHQLGWVTCLASSSASRYRVLRKASALIICGHAQRCVFECRVMRQMLPYYENLELSFVFLFSRSAVPQWSIRE